MVNKLKLPTDWKEYPNHDIIYPHSTRFFQKRIYDKGETQRISLQVVEYLSPDDRWEPTYIYETDMQIPCHLLDIKHTLNIKVFTYIKPDFEKMEKDALKLLERLGLNAS